MSDWASKSSAGHRALAGRELPSPRRTAMTRATDESVKLTRQKWPGSRVLESVAMPIYEYECQGCRRRGSLLVRRPSAAGSPARPRGGRHALSRILSRFAPVKCEDGPEDGPA